MPLQAWRLSHSNVCLKILQICCTIGALCSTRKRSTRHQPNHSPLGIPAVDDTCCTVISHSTRKFLLFWYNMRSLGFPCLSCFVFLDLLHYFLPVCHWKFVQCIWRITEAVCYSLPLGIWIPRNTDIPTAELLNVEYSALWLDVQIFCLTGYSLLRKTVSWGKLEWVLRLEWNVPVIPGEKGDILFPNR